MCVCRAITHEWNIEQYPCVIHLQCTWQRMLIAGDECSRVRRPSISLLCPTISGEARQCTPVWVNAHIVCVSVCASRGDRNNSLGKRLASSQVHRINSQKKSRIINLNLKQKGKPVQSRVYLHRSSERILCVKPDVIKACWKVSIDSEGCGCICEVCFSSL